MLAGCMLADDEGGEFDGEDDDGEMEEGMEGEEGESGDGGDGEDDEEDSSDDGMTEVEKSASALDKFK